MATVKAINVMYEQQLCHLPLSIREKPLNTIFNFFYRTFKSSKNSLHYS